MLSKTKTLIKVLLAFKTMSEFDWYLFVFCSVNFLTVMEVMLATQVGQVEAKLKLSRQDPYR